MSSYAGIIDRYRDYLWLPEGAVPVTLLEGNTPLIPAPRLGRELGCTLYLKFEGLNPTGAFKDRAMTMHLRAPTAGGWTTSITCTLHEEIVGPRTAVAPVHCIAG